MALFLKFDFKNISSLSGGCLGQGFIALKWMRALALSLGAL
jgi:hypothetical protein